MNHDEAPLSTMTDDHLVAEIRQCESTMRALQAKQAKFVAESERRGLHTRDGSRSPSAWLRRLLNLQDRDARSRVLVACKLVPYADSSGQLAFAELSATASALGAGEVSVAHARVIVDEIDKLPEWVSEQQRADMDVFLAGQAKMLPPRELRVVAVRARHDLDPAVKESEEQRQIERRRLRLSTGRDGMTILKGRLDKETGWKLREVLDRFTAEPGDAEGEVRNEPHRRADGLAQLVDFGLNGARAHDGHAPVGTKAEDGDGGGKETRRQQACGRSPSIPAPPGAPKSGAVRRPSRADEAPGRSSLHHRIRRVARSRRSGSLARSAWFTCRRPQGRG